jgi:hypothetical protein
MTQHTSQRQPERNTQGNFTTERERGDENKTIRDESLLCENFKVLKMSLLKSHPNDCRAHGDAGFAYVTTEQGDVTHGGPGILVL